MTRHRSLIIALAALTVLALELTWTRIFSAEFFYTFAFLSLSMAVLGLGLGGLALRLFPGLNRDWVPGLMLSLAGLMALEGPVFIFRMGLDFQLMFASWAMVGKVAIMVLLMGSAFFFAGIAIAWILKKNPDAVPRLYAADLIGAGTGVFAAVWAMNAYGTPAAVFLAPLPILLAAFLACPLRLKVLPVLFIVSMMTLLPQAPNLLETPREERAPVVYKHWDALAKIKMFSFGGYRGLNVDNVANTPIVPFDGDWEAWYQDPANSEWDIHVGHLIGLFDSCTFLSLGSGGGMDVMQALDQGATEIHAVEVNGHINKMMTEGDLAGYLLHDSTGVADSSIVDSTGRIIDLPEYSGCIYEDPRVTVVSEDARTYVRRHPNTFDVIYSLSSNTWAALGSGAFALTENYLFTREAFKDYWNALTPQGFLSMEHQMYMPRLVSEVMEALTELGVETPTDHFAVYNLPRLRRNVLLLSRRPLTDDLRYRAYGELTPEHRKHIHLLYPAPDSLENNLINQIVQKGWKAMADSAAVNLSPSTDDRPFIAQMGRWRNLDLCKRESVSRYAEFQGFPMSRLIIVAILAMTILLVIPLNLLPYLGKGDKLRPVPWLYFFLIGMAFMSVEVILIQKYSLFIGASVYSIGTVLLVLLIASGIGSRFSTRVAPGIAFLGIVAWLLVDLSLLSRLTGALAFLEMPYRVAVTALLIAPLGFFMGIPFPRGALRVGPLVDWGFAVNGVASVLGATLIILVALDAGFTTALLLGGVMYLSAYGLLSLPRGW